METENIGFKRRLQGQNVGPRKKRSKEFWVEEITGDMRENLAQWQKEKRDRNIATEKATSSAMKPAKKVPKEKLLTPRNNKLPSDRKYGIQASLDKLASSAKQRFTSVAQESKNKLFSSASKARNKKALSTSFTESNNKTGDDVTRRRRSAFTLPRKSPDGALEVPKRRSMSAKRRNSFIPKRDDSSRRSLTKIHIEKQKAKNCDVTRLSDDISIQLFVSEKQKNKEIDSELSATKNVDEQQPHTPVVAVAHGDVIPPRNELLMTPSQTSSMKSVLTPKSRRRTWSKTPKSVKFAMDIEVRKKWSPPENPNKSFDLCFSDDFSAMPLTKDEIEGMRLSLDSWTASHSQAPFSELNNLAERVFENNGLVAKDYSDEVVESLLQESTSLNLLGYPTGELNRWLDAISLHVKNSVLNARFWMLRARIYEGMNDEDGAINMYESAVRHNAQPSDEIARDLREFMHRMAQRKETQSRDAAESEVVKHSLDVINDVDEIAAEQQQEEAADCVDNDIRTERGVVHRPNGMDNANVFNSSAIKFCIRNATPFFSKLRARFRHHEGKSLEEAERVVTPVRRSMRLSHQTLPNMLKDHDEIVDSAKGCSATFKPNSALLESVSPS